MENDSSNITCIENEKKKVNNVDVKENTKSLTIDFLPNENVVKLETKTFIRPKILPPEPETCNNNDYEQDASAGLIRLQTRNRKPFRMKPYFSSNTPEQILQSRYLVRLKINRANSQSSASPIRQGLERRVQRVQRCRDFDELGYCLLGNNCSLSHGNNTIVGNDLTTYPSMFTSTVQPSYYQRLPRQRTSSFLVRKIPNDCNNIFKINEYFGHFGEIKHIQVSFDAVDTALVTYEDTESATRAFRSKDPIFNNRFVSLKWYSVENNTSTSMVGQTTSAQTQDSDVFLQFQNRSNFSKTFNNTLSISEPPVSLPTVNTSLSNHVSRRLSKQAKHEKLLSLKADLYLKLNEQARLALLKAKSAPNEECKREWMKKVDRVQESLADVRQTLTVLHEKVQRGAFIELPNKIKKQY